LNTVVRGASDGKRYMTMFVGIIDASKGEIVFASAGHNHPFVISEQPGGKNKIKRLQQIGARLGYCENPEYKNVTKPFLKGEVLVVFSDGLTECRNECGTEFSEVRLRKLLEDLKETHATHVKSTIEAQAFDFYKGTPQEDDITFLVVRGVAENNSQSAHEPIEVRSA
jgi:sigma-B regulation protein RsbU (phosphoserine phosphatase)